MAKKKEEKLLQQMFENCKLVKRSVKGFAFALESGRLQYAQFMIVTMGYGNAFYSFGERLRNVEKSRDPLLRKAIDCCVDDRMKAEQHDWLDRLTRGKMTHQGYYAGHAWIEFDDDDWATPQYRLGLRQPEGSVLSAEDYFVLVAQAFSWWELQLRRIRLSYLENGGSQQAVFDPDGEPPSPFAA